MVEAKRTPSGRRSPADGDSTRAELLETAERLFADQGVGPVSIRTINREAGLSPAAVHYHFGSKEAILEAVIRRLGDPIYDEFTQGVTRLLQQDDQPTTRDAIEIWSDPILKAVNEDAERGRRWIKITAGMTSRDSMRLWGASGDEGDPSGRSASRGDSGWQQDWLRLAVRVCPEASEHAFKRGWAMAVRSLPPLLAHTPVGDSADARAERQAYMAECVDFVHAGFDTYLLAAAKTGTGRQGL